MTVFVDDMFKYPLGRYGRMKMSHLIADSETELHAMAKKIGVARRWYQGDHYDVCLSKRQMAIALGAKPITLRELSKRVQRKRRAVALARSGLRRMAT